MSLQVIIKILVNLNLYSITNKGRLASTLSLSTFQLKDTKLSNEDTDCQILLQPTSSYSMSRIIYFNGGVGCEQKVLILFYFCYTEKNLFQELILKSYKYPSDAEFKPTVYSFERECLIIWSSPNIASMTK